MMKGKEVIPDFQGIEPTRLKEAQRRIAVIEAYLEHESPTASQTEQAAQSIGLSRWQFGRLVSAWRNHRDPKLLVRSKMGPAKRDYGIDQQAKVIAIDAIRKAGMAGELPSLTKQVQNECAARGIKAPSQPTIYNYLNAERSVGKLRYDGKPAIMVGRMWFQIPLANRAKPTMPSLLLAVTLPERRIIGQIISTDPASPPSIAQLLTTLLGEASENGEPRQLLLDATDRQVCAAVLAEHGICKHVALRANVQKIMAQAFGQHLGNLRPVYRPGMAGTKPHYALGMHDEPLSDDMAKEAIQQAILASNAQRAHVGALRWASAGKVRAG